MTPSEKPKKILIIDDHRMNLFVLETVIKEHFDLEVFSAESGQEGLDIVEREEISLILLDMMMPFMSGYDFLKIIKAHPNSTIADLPVVSVTANVMDGERESCLAAGASDYVGKPIDVDYLNELITKYSGHDKTG